MLRAVHSQYVEFCSVARPSEPERTFRCLLAIACSWCLQFVSWARCLPSLRDPPCIKFFDHKSWEATELGNCPKRENPQKWSGEGAKGFWTQGAKVTQESFAPPKPSFAPVRNEVAPVQEAFCLLGPKDLLHPLLTTFGDLLFLGSFPAPWLPNTNLEF